jgi:phosphoserine phosphatase RsbU/P
MTTSRQRLGDASLRLHRPELAPEDVIAELETLVTELGLGSAPVFVPAPIALTNPIGLDDTPVRVPVEGRAPGGVLEGLLYCSPTDEEALARITVLADHAGVALHTVKQLREVERREASARRIAERLQDALLPTVPEIDGVLVAVRYQAAAREARVGGDFYDVFPLPDGRVLLAVGDVMGKGVEAAGRTSLITHTLRALALQGLTLHEVAAGADQQLAFQDPDLMATLWCGLYEPASGELEFTSLGHPPALLLRADGEPISLTLEGLPVGMRDLAERPREERARHLGSRDLLVLYTDGLVEASGDYVAGQEALLAAVQARRDEPLEDLIDAVLDELLADAGHTDDAVVQALRRR